MIPFAAALLAASPALSQTGFDYEVAFNEGLTEPMDLAAAGPGFVVADKCGTLHYFASTGGRTELGSIADQVNCGGTTSGVIGLATTRDGGTLFVYYTNKVGISHAVAKYALTTGDSPALAIGSGGPIITGLPSAVDNTRNAGGLALAADDQTLFVATGDNSINQAKLAQDVTQLHGKLLRYGLDGSAATGNPSFGSTALKAIYAVGLGRPFRISVDRMTGDVFIADTGRLKWSEISIAKGGENFGWPEFEGNGHAGPGGADATDPVAPIYEYDDYNGFDSLAAVGEPYRPADDATNPLPETFHGTVPVVDFYASWLRLLAPDGTVALDADAGLNAPRAVVTGADGALYVLEAGNKSVARLTWNDEAPTVTMTKPADNARFDGGQMLALEATATDKEDGELTSGFEWHLVLTDGTGAVVEDETVSGATATWQVPATIDIEGELSVTVSVRDSVGGVGTATRTILPNATRVTFGTQPEGFELTIDGDVTTETFTKVYTAGTPLALSCPVEVDTTETLWVFDFWSEGGDREQTWIVPEDDVEMICHMRDHLAPPTPVDEGPPTQVEVTPPGADVGGGDDGGDDGCQAGPTGHPAPFVVFVGLLLAMLIVRRRHGLGR